ncbi:hypothetical protein H4219_001413 [Mycoemilia scoparia]|uniref:Uncharacterized protein n=1 Tax=Mycoemilia scoparia TaxID=417184 RepID=A0A9W8A094_9FUNG|nr:hypothetical protein H4219_001413 [Mycoemilia scoparia]
MVMMDLEASLIDHSGDIENDNGSYLRSVEMQCIAEYELFGTSIWSGKAHGLDEGTSYAILKTMWRPDIKHHTSTVNFAQQKSIVITPKFEKLILPPTSSSQHTISFHSIPGTMDPYCSSSKVFDEIRKELECLELWYNLMERRVSWERPLSKSRTRIKSEKKDNTEEEAQSEEEYANGDNSVILDDENDETKNSRDDDVETEIWQHRFNERLDRFLENTLGLFESNEHDTNGNGNHTDNSASNNDHNIFLFCPQRNEAEDLDFTERLWKFAVQQSRDSSDLVEILTALAEALETIATKISCSAISSSGNSNNSNDSSSIPTWIRPKIHKTNKSQLSDLIRMLNKMESQVTSTLQHHNQYQETQDQDPSSAIIKQINSQLDYWIDEQPLECFVMIGLDKLRADYKFYFSGQNGFGSSGSNNPVLITAQQLDQLLDADIVETPAEQIRKFWILHRVLEVWWLVHQSAPNLPHQIVSQAISGLLNSLDNKYKGLDDGDIGDGELSNSNVPDNGEYHEKQQGVSSYFPENVLQSLKISDDNDNTKQTVTQVSGEKASKKQRISLDSPLIDQDQDHEDGDDQDSVSSAEIARDIDDDSPSSEENNTVGNGFSYSDIITLVMYLPSYSQDSHDFTANIFKSFEPSNFQVTLSKPRYQLQYKNENDQTIGNNNNGWDDGMVAFKSWLFTNDNRFMKPSSTLQNTDEDGDEDEDGDDDQNGE